MDAILWGKLVIPSRCSLASGQLRLSQRGKGAFCSPLALGWAGANSGRSPPKAPAPTADSSLNHLLKGC